jgi:hypothetical protein
MTSDAIEQLVATLEGAAEVLAELAYVALQDQLDGETDAKTRERALLSARRAVDKAAHTLRSL